MDYLQIFTLCYEYMQVFQELLWSRDQDVQVGSFGFLFTFSVLKEPVGTFLTHFLLHSAVKSRQPVTLMGDEGWSGQGLSVNCLLFPES